MYTSFAMDSSQKLLPDEIVIKILSYCDGQTFMRCSRTCKQFQRVAAGMGVDNSRYWFRLVRREIEPSIISQLLFNQYIAVGEHIYRYNKIKYEKESAADELYWPARYNPWYQLYVKWFSASKLKNKAFTAHGVDRLHINRVAVIRQSGDLVITGHHNGAVSVYNCITNNLTYLNFHLREVTGIAMVNLTRNRSFNYLENAKCNHHHIISVAKGGHLRCYPIFPIFDDNDRSSTLNIRLVKKDLYDVRVFGNQCAVLARYFIFILKMTQTCTDQNYECAKSRSKSLALQKTHKIPIILESKFFRASCWMIFWKNKIAFIDGLTLKIDLHDITRNQWFLNYLPAFSSTLSLFGSNNEEPILVTAAFTFREKIAFFISNTGRVFVTIDFNKTHEIPILEHFGHTASVISYWGSLLSFGLTNGKIYSYSVLESSKLLSLDLSDPVLINQIAGAGDDPIIALEVFHSGSGYSIAAATVGILAVFKYVS